MTDRLTWLELSGLKLGAVVAFAEPHLVWTVLGTVEVPAGTVCTIDEQGLGEAWGGVLVRPVKLALQQTLVFHQTKTDGCILIEGSADAHEPSPFTLDDSCPVECI